MKMKKWIILFLITIAMVQIATAICCERNKDCIISETCQEADCGDCDIAIYNRDGTTNISHTIMTKITDYSYTYNASKNLTDYGTYPYSINCSNLKTCQGDCQVEVKADCGERGKMEFAIILVLIVINLFVFILPFLVKFSKNQAADYVVRRLLWIASLFLLWFNMTIFRTMAKNYGLGIDNFLEAYWWILTLGAFAGILLMVYVSTIGLIRLMKQINFKRRMGDEELQTSENL